MKTYYIKTFGCQMNEADSAVIEELLEEKGYRLAETPHTADIVVVNTCTVRGMAEHKARSFIGKLEDLKKVRPGAKLVVTGCFAEQAGQKLKNKFPFIDLVIGAKSAEKYDRLLNEFLKLETPKSDLADIKLEPIYYVSVMRGCDNFCSYCIVPHVRGREKSRAPEEIINEIKRAVARGTKDITLLGQNVNSYRGSSEFGVGSSEKQQKNTDFADLLEMVNSIDGIERVRFMTSHPKDLSDRLIDVVAALDKVCKHIHLPLQSGSDRILKLMNRKYTLSEYMEKIRKIRGRINNVCISTDIMVGFPGESKEDFKMTLSAMNEADFDFLFAFKYSARPGTESAKIKDDVSQEEKARRLDELLCLADGISAAKNAKLNGTIESVLVEGTERGGIWGHTRSKKKVFFDGPPGLIGKIVNVKITEPKVNTFRGELI